MERVLFAAALALLSVACSKGSHVPPTTQLTDAGCYLNPTTSLEIINGCTDAGFRDKHPALPLLQADGGLPPLP